MVHINGIKNLIMERGGWEVIPLDVAQIYLWYVSNFPDGNMLI